MKDKNQVYNEMKNALNAIHVWIAGGDHRIGGSGSPWNDLIAQINNAISSADRHEFIGSEEFKTAPMSLRNYFAGQALMGILSSSEESSKRSMTISVVQTSFKIADAMLKERVNYDYD